MLLLGSEFQKITRHTSLVFRSKISQPETANVFIYPSKRTYGIDRKHFSLLHLPPPPPNMTLPSKICDRVECILSAEEEAKLTNIR